MSPIPEIQSLIARAEAKAAEARESVPKRNAAITFDSPSEPDEVPHYERPRFGVIDGDGFGDAASDGRHAGADIDQLMAADATLFDADAYGGRRCEHCGAPIDGRVDRLTCNSSCRGRRWRRNDDGDLDAERARPPQSPRTDQHRPAPVTHSGTADRRTSDPERSNPA